MSKRSPPAVEESVAVNVVPLVDIMFLLLLFLMIGGDMSHRESTELMLPQADRAQEADRAVKDPTSDVDRTAAWFRERLNWQFAIAGDDYPDFWRLVDRLKEVAERQKE